MSAGKAFQILDGFTALERPVTLSEVMRIVGMTKSTTFRLIKQLLESGYLVRRGSEYSLSVRLFELGSRYPAQSVHGLTDVAAPFMGGLFQHTGLIVDLAMLDQGSLLLLDRIVGPQSGVVPGGVGRRLPATVTAMGRAILAHAQPDQVNEVLRRGMPRPTPYSTVAPGMLMRHLEKARAAGFAAESEEMVLGIGAVAAPILVAGSPIGAIGVSGPVNRIRASAVGPLVARAARQIAGEFMSRIDRG